MSKGIALVTGGGAGIGLDIAKVLAEHGHPVVLVGRNEAKLAEAAATMPGVQTWTIALDLAKPGAARELYDRTRELGLDIELLVNNAGVGIYGAHIELAHADVDAMLELNITALTDLCMLYGADMVRRKRGRILNVASTAAYQPSPFFAAYGASKAYVLNFSEALAMEMAEHGVTVTCLSPGPTNTGFFTAIDAGGASAALFAARDSSRAVAELGVAAMMAGKLSKIVGGMNSFRVFSARFAPRTVVAKIARRMMRPERKQLPAAV